jgi:hypothetical protein
VQTQDFKNAQQLLYASPPHFVCMTYSKLRSFAICINAYPRRSTSMFFYFLNIEIF